MLPDGPSSEAALAIAAPVLAALGVSGPRTRVEVGAPDDVGVGRPVRRRPADPWPDDLPRGQRDGIVGGNGYVGTAEPGRRVPADLGAGRIRPAREPADARDRDALPRTGASRRRRVVDPAATMPACGPIEPTVITGAELGLTLQYEGVEPLLVPSWLFITADAAQNPWGPTVIAVDPAYIAEPCRRAGRAAGRSRHPGRWRRGSSGSTPGSPGTVEPGPAPCLRRADARADPEPIPYAVADGTSLAVVWYDSSSCTRELVLEAEAPDSVTVALSKLPPETACTADAVETKGSVTLAEPLGGAPWSSRAARSRSADDESRRPDRTGRRLRRQQRRLSGRSRRTRMNPARWGCRS